MASGFLKRPMSYLGLTDDGYVEDEVPLPEQHLDSLLSTHESCDEEEVLPTRSVQPLSSFKQEGSSTVSLITPRMMRAKSTELSPHVQAVAPTEFSDARLIADSVMASQPVIVNLQTASRELKRRMIDFCSGVTYALGGGMERVADGVFVITPSDVELSADERQRA